MARKPSGRSERANTDESLRDERKNTDHAIRRDRTSAERISAGVIQDARTVADTAVKKERAETDRMSRSTASGAVTGQRATDDRTVRGQRASADAALRSDLAGRADALEALLVHERAATDAHLLTERARSDDDLTNRDDFLGMVAHDVRNLLNLVVWGLEMVQPGTEPAAHRAATDRIRRYVARMNRLVGDLVDVTSIDAGKLAVDPIEADAGALMREATETFRPAAVDKGIHFLAEVPAAPLLAVFDHDRMLQVFANLLANAIKFTPRGGEISVRVEPAGEVLRFSVADTGVGIPTPLLGAIFERFWQVGENDRRGMGLGLYISKSIVDAHRGRIWAESEVGKGSQLCFTLRTAGSRGDEGRSTKKAGVSSSA